MCKTSVTIFLLILAGFTVGPAWADDIVQVFLETFESGQGLWSADNGIWEVGTPIEGCFAGATCAGTILSGNYPNSTSSRFISPPITLPQVLPTDGRLYLRFQQRFGYEAGFDFGFVQISEDAPVLAWSTLGAAITGSSPVWSQRIEDVTAYAGKRVRLGFRHTADVAIPATGWNIDNVEIIAVNPESSVDHYKCYTVIPSKGAPKFAKRDVMLEDQFESKNTTVIKPLTICNPVDKNGEGIHNATDHLVCYDIKDVLHQPKFQKRNVEITNQFNSAENPLKLTATKSDFVCVPSLKTIVPGP